MRHDPAGAAIVIMLRSLKMPGMAQAVHDLMEQGAPAFDAAIPILSQLLKAEMAEREVRSISYHMKAARFPAHKDLSGFDFAASEVNEALVRQLHRCEFLDAAENVVLIGGPGTGKSHVATALGVQAIEHHRKRVRFFSTVELVNALEQEKALGRAGKIAEALVKTELVILDELGYLPFSASGGALLFHLLSKLYERTSVVITTNLSFGLIGGKVREPVISSNWPDILRAAATMVAGAMPPSQLLRKFAAYPRQHELAVALREIGRIERTLFIIDWLLDADMQHRAQIGLNKGEAHHALKNALRIGRQGEIRDRTAQGQHFRMAGLNLLAAIIIYWNTRHLGHAVDSRRSDGLDCSANLLAHISPLGWAHILLTGEYRWPKRA